VCFSSSNHHALHDAQKLWEDLDESVQGCSQLVDVTSDSWVIGPHSQLLLWVPGSYHTLLYSPRNALVLPRGGPELDMSKMLHGQTWHQCH
ncbi:hypothetical protein F5141DRAFT_986242, partial [Pisolithus sp. B1]